MRAVIIFATCEGQTGRIAKRIAETLFERGIATDTFDITRNNVCELAVDAYQAVVFGSSLHYGSHDPRIAWCIRKHLQWLKTIPTAFFSVSLGIQSQRTTDRTNVQQLANAFLHDQNFEPTHKTCFAGALRNSQYGWLKKQLMHWIAKKSGSETRTDRDYEYTDWDAVDTFASEFAEVIDQSSRPKQAKINPTAMYVEL